MFLSLFPDLFPEQTSAEETSTQNLKQALRELPLEVFSTHAERRKVLKLLAQNGITQAWQLLQAHREEMAQQRGIGPTTLLHIDEMRATLNRDPHLLLKLWHDYHAKIQIPELAFQNEELTDALSTSILEVEAAFTNLLQLLAIRCPREGELLRRFFLEGVSIESILGAFTIASRRSLFRIIRKRFLQPLLRGDSLFRLSLSPKFLEQIEQLRRQLLFMPATCLEVLQSMTPPRFLLLLKCTLLQRSQTEAQWACDFIVKEGEITRSRSVLSRLIALLQQHSLPLNREKIQELISAREVQELLLHLLSKHPWLEQHAQGISLMSEHLTDERVRLARILAYSPQTMSMEMLLANYEQLYLERPSSRSLRQLEDYRPKLIAVQ